MREKSYLLATDLDNTLVGNTEATRNLFEFYRDKKFNLALVYITGRHLDSALSLMEQEGLPAPDILITDVGTAIYHAPDWSEDQTWSAWLNEIWAPDKILSISEDFTSLVQQQLPHQKRISYTLHSHQPKIVHAFQTQLNMSGVLCNVVYSSGRDLDILPERSGKGKALEYVLRKYANNDVHLLIAGDSGNDAEMLSLEYPAVIVGNAQPELDKLPLHTLLYRAEGHYANGILEAWKHFYPAVQTKKPIGH